MAKGKKKIGKSPMVRCPNCGRDYQLGAPHRMFCPACTCRQCGRTVGYVLPVYDSRPAALDENGSPERRCDDCLEQEHDNG